MEKMPKYEVAKNVAIMEMNITIVDEAAKEKEPPMNRVSRSRKIEVVTVDDEGSNNVGTQQGC